MNKCDELGLFLLTTETGEIRVYLFLNFLFEYFFKFFNFRLYHHPAIGFILVQPVIFLMIIFRCIEMCNWFYPGNDRPVIYFGLVECTNQFIGNLLLFPVLIKDDRAILGTNICTLTIKGCRGRVR